MLSEYPVTDVSPQSFLDAIPHAKALSIRIESIEDGRVRLSMPYNVDLVGDPSTGVVHGGAVFTLLDTACGIAAMTHPSNVGGTATLDLRVDYMRPASPGQRIHAEAHCYNMTRSVAFLRAIATDEDAERPVASATGAFTNSAQSRPKADT